jgi:UDP-N-acetylmuramate: L-alanyl-gamma-D-glutamyl-meso-diaminopimelate ligase
MKNNHIHILGIAGTFMGGIAQLAKAKGFKVSGSDKAIYPPMSTQLEQASIQVNSYANDTVLDDKQIPPDIVVIGNSLSRGHELVEQTLNSQQIYQSGPQWLAENILQSRWVVAVAGTHGKTTTASMVAWILEYAGLKPGFLIGGVPDNFGVSAQLGESPFFVVEADEYDTAFFDKRSKFVHYHPRTCIINNLEFDHADIFDSLADIQRQFHHLIRTIPNNGLIIYPETESNVDEVLQQGCWTPTQSIANNETKADWQYQLISEDGSSFKVLFEQKVVGEVYWEMNGLHSVSNGLNAIAAAVHCGVPVAHCIDGLCQFKGVQRRMSLIGTSKQNIKIYDDFAHHPTAIETTLHGAKKAMSTIGNGRLIAVFEPRSNTMRMGIHSETLPKAFSIADEVFAFIDPEWKWQLATDKFRQNVTISQSYEQLLSQLQNQLKPNDTVVIMSNGSFGGLHHKLLEII